MPFMSFEDLGAVVQARPPRLGAVRVVAVDGRAGSGKTTFATRLARAMTGVGVEVALLHTDDLLEGWGHPTDFSDNLRQWILGPLAAGEPARYRVYDWVAGRFGDDWHDISRPSLLIVEGVTAAAAAWRPTLSYSVWMETDPDACLRRGIERDGEALRSHWEAWRVHEEAHFRADRTAAHVDLVVAGQPDHDHDPQKQFLAVA